MYGVPTHSIVVFVPVVLVQTELTTRSSQYGAITAFGAAVPGKFAFEK